MHFKSKTDREGEKMPLFPLAREEGEGAAEVQGQGENREKRERKRKSQGEECQR